MSCELPLEASPYVCSPPVQPPDGAVYTPYVKLKFPDGTILTGGNASNPPENLAAITSFDYGFASGTQSWGINIEAVDNGGGTYQKVLKSINKTITNVQPEYNDVEVDFGWIIKFCDGSVTTDFASKYARIHAIFLKCDMTFESGNVKMKIELRAPSARDPDVRHAEPMAPEDNKMHLKQALEELFTQRHPKFNTVTFKDKDGNGPFEFKNSGEEGPLSTWPCDQQSSLNIARKWLNGVVTQNDRGILIGYDSDGVEVVIQEDPSDDCCARSKGTFVVNGGNCSPVISFNPTIAWDKGFVPGGGGATGAASSGDNNEFAEPVVDIEKAGVQTSVAVEQDQSNFRNPDDQAADANLALSAHEKAEEKTINGPSKGWEAELKLIGQVKYQNLVDMIGATVAIVFINPFYIGNCVWLQESVVNRWLSNKNYMILGVNHQISAGSYTTSLKLKLPIPNVTLDADAPLGACGTEVPDNSFATDANGNG